MWFSHYACYGDTLRVVLAPSVWFLCTLLVTWTIMRVIFTLMRDFWTLTRVILTRYELRKQVFDRLKWFARYVKKNRDQQFFYPHPQYFGPEPPLVQRRGKHALYRRSLNLYPSKPNPKYMKKCQRQTNIPNVLYFAQSGFFYYKNYFSILGCFWFLNFLKLFLRVFFLKTFRIFINITQSSRT
jgi:hypothetical protein